jgi:subtilisin-like proprotein convertase family protein
MTHFHPGRRKRLALTVTTALLALGITAGTASAATTTFSNPGAIVIPDSGVASPYPSTISVNGFAGNVQKATVTLHRITHTCLEDVDALLVSPGGAKTILMGEVGSCPQSDIGFLDLTFDQASPNTLNNDVDATSGTYRPSEGSSATTSLTPPAPSAPYPVNLDAVNGGAANGTWQLFIEDCCGADEGQVAGGWSLNLTAPVNTIKAGKPKLNKKKGTAQIPVTVADAGTLTLKGKGVKSASASKAKAVSGPGTVKLTVKPKGKTASKLNSTGSATAKVKITFTPNGGAPKTVKKKVKLKKTLG